MVMYNFKDWEIFTKIMSNLTELMLKINETCSLSLTTELLKIYHQSLKLSHLPNQKCRYFNIISYFSIIINSP